MSEVSYCLFYNVNLILEYVVGRVVSVKNMLTFVVKFQGFFYFLFFLFY